MTATCNERSECLSATGTRCLFRDLTDADTIISNTSAKTTVTTAASVSKNTHCMNVISCLSDGLRFLTIIQGPDLLQLKFVKISLDTNVLESIRPSSFVIKLTRKAARESELDERAA